MDGCRNNNLFLFNIINIGGEKMKYILRNVKYNNYLKYINKWNHCVLDKTEATVFNTTEAKKKLSKFKHPELWEMVRI